MVERDVALAKIALIERALSRIAEVRSKASALDAIDVDELVILNLQRATQAAIDLAAHIVASESFGLPDTLGRNFTILAERSILPPMLAENLRRMAGFRNVAVHAYEEIDSAVVDTILSHHLDDLRSFTSLVIERYALRDAT